MNTCPAHGHFAAIQLLGYCFFHALCDIEHLGKAHAYCNAHHALLEGSYGCCCCCSWGRSWCCRVVLHIAQTALAFCMDYLVAHWPQHCAQQHVPPQSLLLVFEPRTAASMLQAASNCLHWQTLLHHDAICCQNWRYCIRNHFFSAL